MRKSGSQEATLQGGSKRRDALDREAARRGSSGGGTSATVDWCPPPEAFLGSKLMWLDRQREERGPGPALSLPTLVPASWGPHPRDVKVVAARARICVVAAVLVELHVLYLYLVVGHPCERNFGRPPSEIPLYSPPLCAVGSRGSGGAASVAVEAEGSSIRLSTSEGSALTIPL